MAALWTGPICGQPMRFKRTRRERTDLFPVCHRPPHAEREQAEGRKVRHQSWASIDHAREHDREMSAAARMSVAADKTGL